MFAWMFRRAKRRAMQQLVHELFKLNKKDWCWDPIGSVDRSGMDTIIEVIATDKATEVSEKNTKISFKTSLREPEVKG